MYIGEFCKLTAVTPTTIRLYESIGLLPPAQRRGNYRVYDTTYVETVKQIKIAQQFGFTLTELKQMCDGENIKRGLPAKVILRAIDSKRAEIAKQLEQLKQRDAGLADLQHYLQNEACNTVSE
ncbi:MerR family transcriptional regulator [Pseudidiomarina andamanensis]|uniref:MerR family transcriptional regulator n=1 Tax=Pseudidiomarina andamanensis TaxID=1940690 RepID=A0AA92EUN3_9GAMM|nr:MerR family transcriptional regulator [Pseudidiomarina andamanensis]MDS0219317.1 MerR family transcriptional regulator [Pseudidiomarina andamanensis]QGT96051.1 MerR family transcriptional regulator [Pseudidiomarina andamanensis]